MENQTQKQGIVKDPLAIPDFVDIFKKRGGYIPIETQWYFIGDKWKFLYLAKKGSHVLCNDIKDHKLYLDGKVLTKRGFRATFGRLMDQIDKDFLEKIIKV